MQEQHTALVERAQAGEQQAFSELVRNCRGTMYAAAITITRNEQDALDAVQDAILRGWRKLGGLRERQYFRTWITRIAIHCALDIVKKRRRSEPLIEQLPAPGSDLARRMDVRKAIEDLPDTTRLCTILYYLEDMPVAEVARALNLRQGTVKSRLHAARAKLRTVLEGYENE